MLVFAYCTKTYLLLHTDNLIFYAGWYNIGLNNMADILQTLFQIHVLDWKWLNEIKINVLLVSYD